MTPRFSAKASTLAIRSLDQGGLSTESRFGAVIFALKSILGASFS